jgi:hypothetical protein
MPPYITRHLAAAGGMADVDGIPQIQMRRQGCQVICILIHVVAVARLAGSAVAASVMCDDPIAVTKEEKHLRVPVVGRKWPTVAKNDGLTFAPVFVENFRAVFCFDGAHCAVSLAISRGCGFADVFSTASAFAVGPVSPASATPPIRIDRRVVKGWFCTGTELFSLPLRDGRLDGRRCRVVTRQWL